MIIIIIMTIITVFAVVVLVLIIIIFLFFFLVGAGYRTNTSLSLLAKGASSEISLFIDERWMGVIIRSSNAVQEAEERQCYM